MALSAKDDILSREIESWNNFSEGLRAEDKKLFKQMLRQCYRHIKAINAKGETFPTESLLMALILEQQQLIEFLLNRSKLRA